MNSLNIITKSEAQKIKQNSIHKEKQTQAKYQKLIKSELNKFLNDYSSDISENINNLIRNAAKNNEDTVDLTELINKTSKDFVHYINTQAKTEFTLTLGNIFHHPHKDIYLVSEDQAFYFVLKYLTKALKKAGYKLQHQIYSNLAEAYLIEI